MSVFWLEPAAWWGLLALAIPVLIHLLVRQQSRRLLFPSLRFLHATRLAAFARRSISDWPLLMVRGSILAAAVAALAAPVLVSAARRQQWNQRIARAVVVAARPMGQERQPDDRLTELTAQERATAFASMIFTPAERVVDSLRAATDWLDRQPPAAREIVILGDLRDGALYGVDVAGVPGPIGIRFVPLSSTPIERHARLNAIADFGGATSLQQLELLLDDVGTTVDYRRDNAESASVPIEVHASPEDQARAEAMLRAVLAEGILLHRDATRQVTLEFEGAPSLDRPALTQPARLLWMRRALAQLPDVRGGQEDGRLVVRAGMRASDPRALHLLARVARTTLADDLHDLEPRVIPASTLASWSRPPGPVGDGVRPGDEGDRRYFWIVALALLALEHWMRRSQRTLQERTEAADEAEARVA